MITLKFTRKEQADLLAILNSKDQARGAAALFGKVLNGVESGEYDALITISESAVELRQFFIGSSDASSVAAQLKYDKAIAALAAIRKGVQ